MRGVTANDIVDAAALAMKDRAAERDSAEGERSMAKTVALFNLLRGKKISEEDGWWFMACLKAARATQGKFQLDDYVDGAAYIALAGECASGPEMKVTTRTFPFPLSATEEDRKELMP